MITKKLLEQWRQDYVKYLDPERVKPGSDLNWYIAQRAAGHALGLAQEACKQSDLKAEEEGKRLTLTSAHHIIGSLK